MKQKALIAEVYALASLSRYGDYVDRLRKDGRSTSSYQEKYQLWLRIPFEEMSCMHQAEWKLWKLFSFTPILANIVNP